MQAGFQILPCGAKAIGDTFPAVEAEPSKQLGWTASDESDPVGAVTAVCGEIAGGVSRLNPVLPALALAENANCDSTASPLDVAPGAALPLAPFPCSAVEADMHGPVGVDGTFDAAEEGALFC